jgi:hypothetical protein
LNPCYKPLKSITFVLFTAVSMLYSLDAQAKVYAFSDLYKSLNYSSSYFEASSEQLQSLDNYTAKEDNYYTEINGYLRFYPASYTWYGTSPEDAAIEVKNIDAIFKAAPTIPADITLFRGVTLGWHKDRDFAIGEEFLDKAYVSTSTDIKVATQFAGGVSSAETDGKKSKGALFMMYFLNKKPVGLLIDREEDEVILPHGQKFRIVGVKQLSKFKAYLVQICDAAVCVKNPAPLEQVRIFERLGNDL